MTLEELQERLQGTYDLRDLVDCQSVIRMLLRDLDAANSRAERASTDLKSLAFMVNRGNPKAADKAERIIAGAPKRSDAEVMECLLAMSKELEHADALSDEDLTTEVFREVWGNLSFDGRPSAVLEELLLRFKKLTGQKVGDDDE